MRLLLLFCFSLLSFNSGAQQTWQWAKSGGSGSLSLNNDFERVLDIATDKWGNCYFLGITFQSGMNVDGNYLNGFGSKDIVLASFSCDGSYRWAKVFGTSVNGDEFRHIATDTIGGVYIAGYMGIYINNYTAHIDTDTSITNTNKSMMLVKFDTAGVYQWLRMPQADTVSAGAYSTTGPLGLDVDGAGNIYMLSLLPSGAYADGAYVAASSGIHILRYNAQGVFQSGFQMDMNATGMALLNLRFKKDHANGRIYVGGNIPFTATVTIGGNNIPNSMYAAAFSSQGQHLWTQQSSVNGNSGFYSKPAIDDSGYVYLSGISSHGDTFAGYNVVNTLTTITHALPFVVKLDSLGSIKWANNASVKDFTTGDAMTLRSNDEIVVTGSFGEMLNWNGYNGPHLGQGLNPGGDLYLTRINAHTGAIIKNDSLASGSGTSEYPTALATSSDGGIILGGRFPGTLFAGTADTLYMMGGETDFFIAKYGYPCGCIPPVSDFNYSGSNWTVAFNYSGTGQHDSLRWYFGDGSTSTQTNPSHTYNFGGNYTVCVTAYNACDSSQYCETIQVTVGVNTIAGIEDISVYPNPAKEMLHLKGLMETTNYRLLTVTGAVIQQGALEPANNGISTADLPPGMYLLELNNKQQQGVVRIMK
ncbi:MAG: T9SS type A sorting domain-containing protein [Flavipsychrobacter sp.]|nr:T9SS type A sorting domain-containing protein [Flavipsychrobacter sp.]